MTTRREQTYSLTNLVLSWEPPKAPHCSNCRHAIVGGHPEEPTVTCAMGHGPAEISLWRLARARNARGFRSASECPDFDSMSDEEGT